MRAGEIEALVRAYHEAGAFSGAVLVAEGDRVSYEGGFGFADRRWNVANTPDTKFLIGSTAKQFTAILVLRLSASGLIDLDASVTEFLPEYRADTGRLRLRIHGR